MEATFRRELGDGWVDWFLAQRRLLPLNALSLAAALALHVNPLTFVAIHLPH